MSRYDLSYYVKRRLRVLINNGTWGAVLILILLFLLLAPHIAFTAALDIPVTFLATIAIMYFSGWTINLLSMFGLIMVIGMLVDDAIIMAENIYRHIETGEDVHHAAVKGAEEVMKPVSAANDNRRRFQEHVSNTDRQPEIGVGWRSCHLLSTPPS